MLEQHNGYQDTITDDEIEGAYEMVTEHLFPYHADQLDEIIATMGAKVLTGTDF